MLLETQNRMFLEKPFLCQLRFLLKLPVVSFLISLSGRDPFNQNLRKFRSKTQWIGSVQPEKFRKNRVHLLRWTTFPGRTGWNFG